MITTHAMDTATWWGRGGTEVDAGQRCAIGLRAQYRPGQQVPYIERSAVYRSSDKVGVVAFEVGTVHDMAREDAVAKTWRESFDLVFDGSGQVGKRTTGGVAIRPGNVLTRGRPRGIADRGLCQEDERCRC